jgi:peptide/nickel transport system substrate-binding protein
MEKKALISIIPCFIILCLFVVPTGATNQGNTLTVGLEYDPGGFDALKAWASGPSATAPINAIQERLFDIGDNSEIVSKLGISAVPEENRKNWVIKLRKGVYFHDGTPFNADAVIHHWKRLLNPENRYKERMYVQPIQSVEKVDDYTVRFILKHPWMPFRAAIASIIGFSSYIPSPKAVDKDKQNRAPVGTGPFMFKEWKSQDRLVVVKNPNYWRRGKPYVDKIVFRFIPDHQTRFASLQAGEVDIIWTDRGNHIHQAAKEKKWVVHKIDETGAEVFLLNNTKAPLDNPVVRRALAYAWDQSKLVKMVYKDTIPVIQHTFGATLMCDDLAYREHNPQQAIKLLKGLKEPLVIEYLHTNTLRGREHGAILQQLFKAVGVEVILKSVNVPAMIKNVFTNNYQISSWRTVSIPDQGPALFAQFHSKSPYNLSHYNNPKMDELLEKQSNSIDPKQREAYLCKIARFINEDAPVLYRGGRSYHAISHSRLKGLPSLKQGVIRLDEAWIED